MFIVGAQTAYKHLWLIGDEFLMKAIGHLLGGQNCELQQNSFMTTNFTLKPFYTNNLDLNRSILGRLRNTLVRAINEQWLLPRMILIILDDDVIESIKFRGKDLHILFEKMVKWLASEFNKLVEIHKEKLTPKAVRKDYPTFICLTPPQNIKFRNNDLRALFARSTRNALMAYPGHISLQLKKIWEFKDSALFANYFTNIGFKNYWRSVDSAIQFWIKQLAPKIEHNYLQAGEERRKLSSAVVVPDKQQQPEAYFTMAYKQDRPRIFDQQQRSFRSDTYHWHRSNNHRC